MASDSIKKILVINVNWVGDVVFSTPVFKSLKKNYPQATLTCLGVPRVREILESSSYVDEVIIYDEDGIHGNPLMKLKLIMDLRRRKFDVAFLLHRSLTRALLVYLAGIPQRVGYDTKGRGRFLTHMVEPREEEVTHRSDYYINVIESYGIKVTDRSCELSVSNKDSVKIAELLKKYNVEDNDFLIVVNSGGNWDLKRWPQHNFALLVKYLMKQNNAKVVIPGAQKDTALAETIMHASGAWPILLAGQTTLKQLVALMQRANLVVSADSGPFHLANSVGTDAIGLYGPTRPEVTGPRGKGRTVILQNDVGCNRESCYHLQCPDNVCMQSITIDDVIQEITKIRN